MPGMKVKPLDIPAFVRALAALVLAIGLAYGRHTA